MKAEQQIAAMPRSAVLLQYVFYDSRHMVELHGVQAFQAGLISEASFGACVSKSKKSQGEMSRYSQI